MALFGVLYNPKAMRESLLAQLPPADGQELYPFVEEAGTETGDVDEPRASGPAQPTLPDEFKQRLAPSVAYDADEAPPPMLTNPLIR
ncbi:MAG: hypothetical protein JWO59_742 [Chloroflexi bacterium]|nr:hypothetical protein [Chloroflexota bacterium]